MMTVEEALAGIAFLGRYAPEALRPYIRDCENRITTDIHDARILSARHRSVDELEISVRLANILQAAGCKTVADAEDALISPTKRVLWAHAKKAERELTAMLREVLGRE